MARDSLRLWDNRVWFLGHDVSGIGALNWKQKANQKTKRTGTR